MGRIERVAFNSMDISSIIRLFSYFALCVLYLAQVAVDGATPKCEVCVGVVNQLIKHLESSNIPRTDEAKVEKEILKLCKTLRGKEEKFCGFIGASQTSSTYIVRELTGPLSRFLPAEKVCEKLKTRDSQVCDLTYDKEIDWSTVDLNKLKVKDLKKILDGWGEVCKACSEKTEFIARVKELMPKFVKKTEL